MRAGYHEIILMRAGHHDIILMRTGYHEIILMRAGCHEIILMRAGSHEIILMRAECHEIILMGAGRHEVILMRAGSHEIILMGAGRHEVILTRAGRHEVILMRAGCHEMISQYVSINISTPSSLPHDNTNEARATPFSGIKNLTFLSRRVILKRWPSGRTTCPAHLIILDFITRTILGEEYTHQRRDARIFNYTNWLLNHPF